MLPDTPVVCPECCSPSGRGWTRWKLIRALAQTGIVWPCECKGPHRLVCLNTRLLVGGTVWEGAGVCSYWRRCVTRAWALRFQTTPIIPWAPCLLLMDWDASCRRLRLRHACLLAVTAMVSMGLQALN